MATQRDFSAFDESVNFPKVDTEKIYGMGRGDYRVVYVIDDHSDRIEIPHIARRSDVYRL